jgi:GNAT superfamily N-acetyltransferase|tara:strand:- start:3 stop:515 length:513 start_codon:yes stop_codon:yes gene_type:complete
MSPPVAVQFRVLKPSDESVVKTWLREYLRMHIGWWVSCVGSAWSPERIDAHIDEHDLLGLDWDEMIADVEKSDRFSTVAWSGARALGVVSGGTRKDRYFCGKKGHLGWIFVDGAERGQGVGRLLMEWSEFWYRSKGVELREIFVTQHNEQAIGLYEAGGYRAVDLRMLRK